ncbi:MAG: MFS transporter [Paludibacterium sp.]|uniref:MFS transporter n=1 Tax=Paludibacterium sp. TaxID=1917523 RepID=UPI0025FFD7B1|nr:MFS transporter [Paludibacterium sp.]MBV8049079.1 MFS transporter [Paludibacterium sp.]MBV8649411.1 MFS transporter [Paludibacterium sp.]
MKLVAVLRDRAIRRLWSALTLSCIGAEFYAFAIVWLATDRLGYLASYLVALQAAIVLFATFTAGALTDGVSNRRMMVWSDFVRVAGTLLPFVWWLGFGDVPLTVLAVTIVLVSYFRPVFDPALQATIPAITRSPSLLQAINGLFDVVRRVARVIGPALAAFLFARVPVYAFFLLNAITFLISGLAILSLGTRLDTPVRPATHRRAGLIGKTARDFFAGWQAMRAEPTIHYHLLAYAICNGGWYVSLVVCVALRIHAAYPAHSSYFGYVIGIYGLFNVLSNLVFSEVPIKRPVLAMSLGRVLSGVALLAMAWATRLPGIMLFAAIASLGAPITQIPLATLMQTHFEPHQVVRVFRIRMFYEWLFLLLALLLAPSLLRLIGVDALMAAAALVYVVLGAVGLKLTRELPPRGAWPDEALEG